MEPDVVKIGIRREAVAPVGLLYQVVTVLSVALIWIGDTILNGDPDLHFHYCPFCDEWKAHLIRLGIIKEHGEGERLVFGKKVLNK